MHHSAFDDGRRGMRDGCRSSRRYSRANSKAREGRANSLKLTVYKWLKLELLVLF